MSNTWDYRFAFHVQTPSDVPLEFRSTDDRLQEIHGAPILSLFTPAVDQSSFLFSRPVSPRLILLFLKSLAVLSLETHSDEVQTVEWSSLELLAYGRADFLLNCWFSLYPGPSGYGPMRLPFPSRATEKFEELSRLLVDWLDPNGMAPRDSIVSAVPGVPKKFASFLASHAEFGPMSEFFYQPAMDRRGKDHRRWPNLLMVAGARGIVVLADERRGESSEYGLEMTLLPLRRVGPLGWTESDHADLASIRVCLKGAQNEVVLSWPVYSGLKPYALRWTQTVESLVAVAKQNQSVCSGRRAPNVQATTNAMP